LTGHRISGHEDSVVPADIADHFGQIAAIECERDPLRGADSGLDDGQVWTGRQDLAQELSDGRELCNA
jgi:hypothetical protein